MSTQTLIIVLVLLFIHWIADFLTQNDWQATNKSKSWVSIAAPMFNADKTMLEKILTL